MEADVVVKLQGTVLAASAVEFAQEALDVAGRMPVALHELELLRVEVLLTSRKGAAFTEFIARIHAPVRAEQSSKRGADLEDGRALVLDMVRQDVRRVGPEVAAVV